MHMLSQATSSKSARPRPRECAHAHQLVADGRQRRGIPETHDPERDGEGSEEQRCTGGGSRCSPKRNEPIPSLHTGEDAFSIA